MHIAIEGCAHGELETIYKCITDLEAENQIKIGLLICCGDFQSVRNENDLRCMAVPPKYYNMCSFYKYYSGQLVAPTPTIFIGGNHEASNYLQELPFGGWVAPNIYYLGYAGVVKYKGLRIGGISGIYKGRDYQKGHFESSPYGEDTKRSVYHIRNVEVFRLKQIKEDIDIFLSHDWPSEITKYGNVEQLLRFKPFFKNDIESGNLGSPPCDELLTKLQPSFWFAAHLHCKFVALVPHESGKTTKFLALDKCVPKKRFLQVLEIPTKEEDSSENSSLEYDLEWLSILQSTPNLFSTRNVRQYMPSDYEALKEEEREQILTNFGGDLTIPNNFKATAPIYTPGTPIKGNIYQPDVEINPQTTELCSKLGIFDPTEALVKEKPEEHEYRVCCFDNSFIEDTDVSFDECLNKSLVLSSGCKRKSLILPDVVNKPESEKEIDAEDSVIGKSPLSSYVGVPNDEETGKESEQPKDSDAKPESEEKPVKKMKRRNASIYDSEDV